MKTSKFSAYFIVALALLFSSRLQVPLAVYAQSETDSGWDVPVNLSRAGGSTNPIAVVDSNGVTHIVWQDPYNQFVYVRGTLSNWSEPEGVVLPAEKDQLTLVADTNGFLHAFWLSKKGALEYSAVDANSFNIPANWLPVQTLSEFSAAFAVDVDASGAIHLAYIKNLLISEEPDDQDLLQAEDTGIYYQKLLPGAGEWSTPTVIFASDYYRSISKSDANIEIVASGEVHTVHIAWDDIQRRRIYMVRSLDDGLTWYEVEEVDNPSSQLGIEKPFNVNLAANGTEIVRIWQRGLPGEYCTQYYQMSLDNGETWNEPQLMYSGVPTCPEENVFLDDFDDFILLQTMIQNQSYWMVFHEGEWSEPKIQPALSGFQDPDTLLDVSLGCPALTALKPDVVLALGCGINGGGDIWLLTRKLGSIEEWFPPPSVWTQPILLDNPVKGRISNPIIVAGPNNRFHAIWTQHDDSILSSQENQLYYSFWDGVQWTEPLSILGLVDVSVLEPLDVKITSDGRILVVWNGQPKGTIYFSWANANRAFLPSEWTAPVALTTENTEPFFEYENSPRILSSLADYISVVFSISINDGRGIYIVESEDRGKSWTEPQRIIDGVSNNWDVIGPSEMAVGADGVSHVLLGYQESPFISKVSNIVYARLLPDRTVTKIEDNLHNPQDEDELVIWYKVIADNASGVNLLWQTQSMFGPTYVWHQYSSDGGFNFDSLPSLQRFSDTSGTVDASLDPQGNLHLVLVDQTLEGKLLVRNQIFEDGRWAIEEDLRLDSPQKFRLKYMSSVYTQNGYMGVFLTGEKIAEGLEEEDLILFLSRLPSEIIEKTEEPVRVAPRSVPTVEPTSTQETLLIPSATPESLVDNFVKAAPPPSGGGSPLVTGLVVGGVLAAVIVIYMVLRAFGFPKARRTNS